LKIFRSKTNWQRLDLDQIKGGLEITTCPKCARIYGHNYVVAFAEV
jgi:hypothetical protein